MGAATARTGTELTLPARPESIAVARRAVARLGREIGLPDHRLDDLRTVVSEACTNATIHAYDGPGGEFELRACAEGSGARVTVSDRGAGIRPRPAYGSSSPRLGLLLIAALADSVEIASRHEGGTRLSIRLC